MNYNKELYNYLISNVQRLSDEWYERLDKSASSGVYASSDPAVIQHLKKQNKEFHLRFFEVFNKDESEFLIGLEAWIIEVALDEEHLQTPLHLILQEFNRTHDQYVQLIDEFVETVQDEYGFKEILSWYRLVDKTFNEISVWFVQEHTKNAEQRIETQHDLIIELSSPVISLNRHVALLPLVGDIDSTRSKVILEKTLEQCSRNGVNYLLLDISGVVKIDENVAEELMQLIDSLKLIGVTTTLSGLRPEIAQSAVKLGLTFDNISIKSSLSDSIKFREFALE
ncbi:STAS domain-containing protein [Salipaludibacillus daqingensis]|uniref:STAS domain-containing protein n=1 Tax=Salipaludibacillus daqingensis TaxID=3041001 RepID=UPI0024746BCB|nr:STAS domain-containing protein [Salipaludibacillus daqingensis]